jgi:hypothetical protein
VLIGQRRTYPPVCSFNHAEGAAYDDVRRDEKQQGYRRENQGGNVSVKRKEKKVKAKMSQ